MRYLCFDVDGTLVNSRDLVRRAYLEAGVRVPERAWGITWREWLVDYCDGNLEAAQVIHKTKTDIYERLLLSVDVNLYELPAARVARMWLASHGVSAVSYLTAGSPGTAWSWVSRLDIVAPLNGDLTYEKRLAKLQALPAGMIYLDDNPNTLERLSQDLPDLRTIHIKEQTYDELLYRVGELHHA